MNFVDVSVPRSKYEERLYKYSKRGFGVLVPNVVANKFNKSVSSLLEMKNVTANVKEWTGLAKLISLFYTKEDLK